MQGDSSVDVPYATKDARAEAARAEDARADVSNKADRHTGDLDAGQPAPDSSADLTIDARLDLALDSPKDTPTQVTQETWRLHAQPIEGAWPPPRAHAAYWFDSTTGQLFLYGGKNIQGVLSDLWQWDVGKRTWTMVAPLQGVSPGARWLSPAAYDARTGRAYLYGGHRDEERDPRLSDLWEYHVVTRRWTRLDDYSPPSSRAGHALVYDPIRSKVLMFGGFDGFTRTSAVWEYSPATGLWKELNTSVSWPDHPAARSEHAGVFDQRRDRFAIIGGRATSAFVDSDVWELDPMTLAWKHRHDWKKTFGRIFGAGLVVDDANNRLLMFGGADADRFLHGELDDLWSFDVTAGTWTRLQPKGAMPAARSGHVFVFDTQRQRALMFGGVGSVYYNDLWELGRP